MGALASAAVVLAATGRLDGFGTPEMGILKLRLLRQLSWTLAGAALLGPFLDRLHGTWLADRPGGGGPPGWTLLPGILRLFVHFPFYGLVLLVQILLWIAWALVSIPFRRERGPSRRIDEAPALWFMLLPLRGLKDEEGRTVAARPPAWGSLAALLPFLLLALALWTGATGEDSGERVDPRLMALAGSYWLGDYLAVLWRLRPSFK